jgi:hypothetical protein
LLEGFEVVFHAQIKRRILRIALAVDGFRHPDAAPGCGEKPHAKATRVPDSYSVGRVIIVHNIKGGLREAAQTAGHPARKTVQDHFPLKRAVKDSTMPEAVAAWGSVPEKLNPNKTFQRTVKTAAELG